MEAGQVFKIGFIIQARMKSDRLPGKVLLSLPIESKNTILDRIIDETSKLNGKIIIATSLDKSNDRIQDYSDLKGVDCFRGSEEDVLSRFITIQNKYKFDHVVRLTADNPFIDSRNINQVLEYHISRKLDYTYSSGLPLGMNIEIMKGEALLQSNKYVKNNKEKEHVTVVLSENETFKSEVFKFNSEFSDLRLTIDTIEDYMLANTITSLVSFNELVGEELVKAVYNLYPYIFDLNRNIYQKRDFSSLNEELSHAVKFLEKYDFHNVAKILKDKD